MLSFHRLFTKNVEYFGIQIEHVPSWVNWIYTDREGTVIGSFAKPEYHEEKWHMPPNTKTIVLGVIEDDTEGQPMNTHNEPLPSRDHPDFLYVEPSFWKVSRRTC
jgi:hypothetical protein